MSSFLFSLVRVVNYISLFYVLAISTIYFIQLVSAMAGLREYSRSMKYTDYGFGIDAESFGR